MVSKVRGATAFLEGAGVTRNIQGKLYVLSREGVMRDKYNGFWFGRLGLLALRLQYLLITINTALSLSHTIYSSPLHTH
jgi:hypothetical protein